MAWRAVFPFENKIFKSQLIYILIVIILLVTKIYASLLFSPHCPVSCQFIYSFLSVLFMPEDPSSTAKLMPSVLSCFSPTFWLKTLSKSSLSSPYLTSLSLFFVCYKCQTINSSRQCFILSLSSFCSFNKDQKVYYNGSNC